MSHLILPISIDGVKYCVKHGAFYSGMEQRWRTVSILSAGDDAEMLLVASEDDDEWLFDNAADELANSPQTNGEVNFGISCINSLSVQFDLFPPLLSGDKYFIYLLLYPPAGGVIELDSGEIEEGGMTSAVLSATGLDGTNPLLEGVNRACGTVIGLRVEGAQAYDGYVGIAITEVD